MGILDWLWQGRVEEGAETPAIAPTDDLEVAAHFLATVAKAELRPYSTFAFGREKDPEGRSVLVARGRASAVCDRVRACLLPGLVCFEGTRRFFGDRRERPHGRAEIVLARGATQFDIIRVARTEPVNFDMTWEDVVRQLQAYDALCGIDIRQADRESVCFRLKTLPADLPAFAESLCEFCPDLDDGIGTITTLVATLRKSRTVSLWWD